MARRRYVYRNYTYLAFGLGIDAVVVLVAVLARAWIVAVALVPVLVFGVRWATMRVVVDERGVRVVNLWRTHRLAWSSVDGFVVNDHNVSRFGRWGRARAFLGLVSVRRTDGGEIALSATSAAGTVTRSDHVIDTWLPALVERFNRARPRAAA